MEHIVTSKIHVLNEDKGTPDRTASQQQSLLSGTLGPDGAFSNGKSNAREVKIEVSAIFLMDEC